MSMYTTTTIRILLALPFGAARVRRYAGARLRSAGYGASNPREPNGTIEGRARNRRVELARNCGVK